MHKNLQINSTDRFLRRKEVEAVTGYSRSSIYRLIQVGEFPRPIALTQRSVRWRASQVAAWQQQIVHETPSQKPGAPEGVLDQSKGRFFVHRQKVMVSYMVPVTRSTFKRFSDQEYFAASALQS